MIITLYECCHVCNLQLVAILVQTLFTVRVPSANAKHYIYKTNVCALNTGLLYITGVLTKFDEKEPH